MKYGILFKTNSWHQLNISFCFRTRAREGAVAEEETADRDTCWHSWATSPAEDTLDIKEQYRAWKRGHSASSAITSNCDKACARNEEGRICGELWQLVKFIERWPEWLVSIKQIQYELFSLSYHFQTVLSKGPLHISGWCRQSYFHSRQKVECPQRQVKPKNDDQGKLGTWNTARPAATIACIFTERTKTMPRNYVWGPWREKKGSRKWNQMKVIYM